MRFPTSRNSRNSCSSFHRDMTEVGSEVHWTFRFPRLGVGAGSRRLLGNQDGPVMLQGSLPSAFSLWLSFRNGQGNHLVNVGLFVGRQFLREPGRLEKPGSIQFQTFMHGIANVFRALIPAIVPEQPTVVFLVGENAGFIAGQRIEIALGRFY